MSDSTNQTKTILREIDIRMDTAIMTRDTTTLESLFADDCIYTHSNGLSESGAEFVAALRSGKYSATKREPSNIHVDVHGDVAITRGDLEVHSAKFGEIKFHYVRVYRLSGGAWKAIAYQSLPAS